MKSPFKARAKKRKAEEQRVGEKEPVKIASSSLSTTTSSSTALTKATLATDKLIDEREDYRPHSDNAPIIPFASSSAAALSEDKQRQRKQRSGTDNFYTAQDKGKQRSLEDQEEKILFVNPLRQPSSRSRSKTSCGSPNHRRKLSPRSDTEETASRVMPTSSRQDSGLSRTITSTAASSHSPPLKGAVAAPSPPPPPLAHSFNASPKSQSLSQSQGADSFGSIMAEYGPRDPSSQRRESIRPPTRQEAVPSGGEKEFRRYLLHILQQPTIGCAFGSNLLSRLAIAPPLIVQLQAIDRAGREISLEEDLPFLVCRVQLTDEEGQSVDMLTSTTTSSASSPTSNPSPTVVTAPTSVRLLYGTLVASPMQLYTQDNRPAIIFVFPEISIRSRGRFQLDVSLSRLPLPSLGQTVGSTIATASTGPFNVVLSADYTAPDVTDLTRHFARQGVGLLLPPDQSQSGPTAD